MLTKLRITLNAFIHRRILRLFIVQKFGNVLTKLFPIRFRLSNPNKGQSDSTGTRGTSYDQL